MLFEQAERVEVAMSETQDFVEQESIARERSPNERSEEEQLVGVDEDPESLHREIAKLYSKLQENSPQERASKRSHCECFERVSHRSSRIEEVLLLYLELRESDVLLHDGERLLHIHNRMDIGGVESERDKLSD